MQSHQKSELHSFIQIGKSGGTQENGSNLCCTRCLHGRSVRLGLFYSKKNATINDFLLAGRDLGVVAATLTVTASLFGGGLLTGTAQYTYDSGVMMYIYGIVGSGGELLSGIVSAVVLVIVSLATQPKKATA